MKFRKSFFMIFLIIVLILVISFIIYKNIIFKNNIPILAYHDVIEDPLNETDISIEDFERQMEYLYSHNYQTLSLDEYYEWKQGKVIDGKKIVLTFDDGDESFYKIVIPILEKYNFKATVFVIQNSIGKEGYLNDTQIKDIKENKANFFVQSHSFNLHIDSFANSNDYHIYNEDMLKNNNNNYKYYAYPFGISNENYYKALTNNNYKLAFLYSPSKWSNKNQNNLEVTRVPIYRSNSLFKFILKVSFKI